MEESSSLSVAPQEDWEAAMSPTGGVESNLQRLFATADNPSPRESRLAGVVINDVKVQGYLAHTKTPPPRILQ
jgi:hypothetical protein